MREPTELEEDLDERRHQLRYAQQRLMYWQQRTIGFAAAVAELDRLLQLQRQVNVKQALEPSQDAADSAEDDS